MSQIKSTLIITPEGRLAIRHTNHKGRTVTLDYHSAIILKAALTEQLDTLTTAIKQYQTTLTDRQQMRLPLQYP